MDWSQEFEILLRNFSSIIDDSSTEDMMSSGSLSNAYNWIESDPDSFGHLDNMGEKAFLAMDARSEGMQSYALSSYSPLFASSLVSSTSVPSGTLIGEPSPTPRPPDKLSYPYQLCLIILYSASAIASFCGNVTVIVVLCCGRRSSSGLRKYLINLAATDILMAIFCIPFT